MPAGDVGFCADYVASPDIDDWINNSQDDFFRKYRDWIADGKKTEPSEMFLMFGGWSRTEEALNKGDSVAGNQAGEVHNDDCNAFNDFVIWGKAQKITYSKEELHSLHLPFIDPRTEDEQLRNAFKVAIAKMFTGVDIGAMTPLERALLNGALLAKVDLSPTLIGDGPTDRRLYAIPGHIVFDWKQPVGDPFWIGVDAIMEDAFEKVGTRLINLNGAVQLRLGATKTSTHAPIVVAPGFTIMGGV